MIVVCGEALIDLIENGDGSQRSAPGGGPFNTARALARLGVPAAFLGRLSSDTHGRELARLLDSDGASLELASVGSEATTMAVARVDAAGLAEYEFLIDGTSAPHLTLDMLPERLGPEVEALHIGTLGIVLEPMASTLVELVRRERHGRLVMVDPNIRTGLVPESEYRHRLDAMISASTIVKASDADLKWLYPELGYQEAAARMVEGGVPLVVVTRGERGAFAVHQNFEVAVEAVRFEVVDTIGAGDAFGAALLAWLHDHRVIGEDLKLEKHELTAALSFASLAAAITCSRAGADPPWRREMLAQSP